MIYAIAEPGIDVLDRACVEEHLDAHPVAGHPPVST
jgi:hypothetical protein